MADKIEQIKIEYDNSDDAMYGSDPDAIVGVDMQASEIKFKTMLHAELSKNYPNVEIIITTGFGQYMVDGDTAHQEVDTVGQILHNVWSEFEWLVTA